MKPIFNGFEVGLKNMRKTVDVLAKLSGMSDKWHKAYDAITEVWFDEKTTLEEKHNDLAWLICEIRIMMNVIDAEIELNA